MYRLSTYHFDRDSFTMIILSCMYSCIYLRTHYAIQHVLISSNCVFSALPMLGAPNSNLSSFRLLTRHIEKKYTVKLLVVS